MGYVLQNRVVVPADISTTSSEKSNALDWRLSGKFPTLGHGTSRVKFDP